MDVQRNLEANVEKRMKDVYGPPPGTYIHVLSWYHVYMYIVHTCMQYTKLVCIYVHTKAYINSYYMYFIPYTCTQICCIV